MEQTVTMTLPAPQDSCACAAASPLEMQLDVMDESWGWAISRQEIALELGPAPYTVTLIPQHNHQD
jgi:hypothetical protein